MTHGTEHNPDEAILIQANQQIELDRATLRKVRTPLERLPLSVQRRYSKLRGTVLAWYWVPGLWSWAKWVVLPLILWLLVLLSMV